LRGIALHLLILLVYLIDPYVTSASVFSLEFGGKGSDPGQFGREIYVAFAVDGSIYVSDPLNSRIQVFDRTGGFLRSIAPREDDPFTFNHIRDITVGYDSALWVADWKLEPISGEVGTRLYLYTPCIHRFDGEGRYLGSITIEDAERYKKGGVLAPIIHILDRQGEASFAIRPEDYDRPLHLASDWLGNLYVLDERRNIVYGYDSSGVLILRFGSYGELDRAEGIECDGFGNIYVADTGNNRIVKFNAEGKFLYSIGRKGRRNGEFISPYLVRVIEDGSLLVVDRSTFKKVFRSYLPGRREGLRYDPSDYQWVLRTKAPKEEERRAHKTWMRRIQRFRPDGSFKGKITLRFSEDEKGLELIGIDRNGDLYLFDPETHRIKVHRLPQTGKRWGDVQKGYAIGIEKGVGYMGLDGGDDIDLGYNYLYRVDFLRVVQSLLFEYDLTEGVTTSLEGSVQYFYAYRRTDYPQEKPPPGGWAYDYLLVDDFIRGRINATLKVVLDPDPYRYRLMRLNLFLGAAYYDFGYDATHPKNLAHARYYLHQHELGAGIDWDVLRDLNLYFSFAVRYPGDFMAWRYRYWDEEGRLGATGRFKGRTVIAYGGINMVF